MIDRSFTVECPVRLRRTRFFQVFGCRTGFLCLELTYKKRGDSGLPAFFRWMAAIWFGPLAIIAQVIMARRSARHEAALDLSSDIARRR